MRKLYIRAENDWLDFGIVEETGYESRQTSKLTRTVLYLMLGDPWPCTILCFFFIAELSRAKRAQRSTGVRKCGKLPTRENLVITWPYTDRPPGRPSAPLASQCKITQSTGMATQMQLEVTGLKTPTGRRQPVGYLQESMKTKTESGIVSVSMFSKVLSLDWLSCPQFGI